MFLAIFCAFVKSAPFLLFDKKVEKENVKIGIPVHVTYTITNLGDKAATDLSIQDSAFPAENWDVPSAASNLKWNIIEPGQTITHIFQVRPLVEGQLRVGSTRLDYVADGNEKIALSTQIFFFESLPTRSIGASSNLLNYTIVISIAFALIIIPFLLWILVKPKGKKTKSE